MSSRHRRNAVSALSTACWCSVIILWQHPWPIGAVGVQFKNRNPYRPRDTPRICFNHMVERPRREEHGLAHVRLAVPTEHINKKAQERIGGLFPNPGRDVEMVTVEKPRLNRPFEDAALRRAIMHEGKHRYAEFVFMSERGGPFSTAGFARLVERAGAEAGLGFKAHPHMLRHSTGYKLANDGVDTRALQHYLGHRNINHTVRYSELAASRFDGFWR
jgi:integrase